MNLKSVVLGAGASAALGNLLHVTFSSCLSCMLRGPAASGKNGWALSCESMLWFSRTGTGPYGTHC